MLVIPRFHVATCSYCFHQGDIKFMIVCLFIYLFISRITHKHYQSHLQKIIQNMVFLHPNKIWRVIWITIWIQKILNKIRIFLFYLYYVGGGMSSPGVLYSSYFLFGLYWSNSFHQVGATNTKLLLKCYDLFTKDKNCGTFK